MNLAILGATGSIGSSTLDVVARHGGRYRVFALTANGKADALLGRCRVHRPVYAVLSSTTPDKKLAAAFAECGTELLFGARALEQVASDSRVDVVMAAIVGAAGLASTLAAARAGKRVLLANKEALVMAGPLVMRAARESGAQLLPVDSEHNAVFQCFSDQGVRKIILTASGGPFRSLPLEKLAAVTPDQACAHPNWVMGRKISVDSATMMNKGLEVIEARWLFDLPPERIEVLIHPESVIHSFVEFRDGSVLAQLSPPDMRLPIQYALLYPERVSGPARRLNWRELSAWRFEQPDHETFPALQLGYETARRGGTCGAVLNAANEAAVERFLAGDLDFLDIPRACRAALDHHHFSPTPTLAELAAA